MKPPSSSTSRSRPWAPSSITSVAPSPTGTPGSIPGHPELFRPMLQIAVQLAGEAQRPHQVTRRGALDRGMGAVETDDPGGREQLGERSGEAAGHRCLGPVMPAQPVEGPVAELGARQVGGQRARGASLDRLAQRLAVHRSERRIGRPGREEAVRSVPSPAIQLAWLASAKS